MRLFMAHMAYYIGLGLINTKDMFKKDNGKRNNLFLILEFGFRI